MVSLAAAVFIAVFVGAAQGGLWAVTQRTHTQKVVVQSILT
jgi:hypothetical protein